MLKFFPLTLQQIKNKKGGKKMYNPEDECKAIIDAIIKICSQKGMTPHALAQKAGISSSTISYLMNGKTKPQMYTVLQLCNILDVTISELLDRKETAISQKIRPWHKEIEEKKLIEEYRYLSDKKKKLLRLYLDMLQSFDNERIEKMINQSIDAIDK